MKRIVIDPWLYADRALAIKANDSATGRRFGARLAACGDVLVAGAKNRASDEGFAGEVYIMSRAGNNYAVRRKISNAPLIPGTARAIADRLDCTLPTPKMVDAIHRAAALKLAPTPRPPGPDMTTVPAFLEYQETVRRQREAVLADHPWGTLTAGHHKDIVPTPRPAGLRGKVAIYGWHRPDGNPIQPLYAGHAATWVDYSHGVWLVRRAVTLNGRPSTVDQIPADPKTASPLGGEPFPAPPANPFR